MSTSQGLGTPRNSVDLSVDPEEYYGAPLHRYQTDLSVFGIEPGANTEMYRVSYLFLLLFETNADSKEGESEYGGMQLRARTHLHLEDGAVPTKLQRHIQRAAHRGAKMYDTAVETPVYDGYLTGFGGDSGRALFETGDEYQNWEVEPISGQEAEGVTPGKIDWHTEIYLDAEGTDYAELSGIASGVANPYQTVEHTEEGREATHIPPFRWEIDHYPESRPGYYEIRPPARKAARERYREGAGAGKAVYINGEKIGELDNAGRVWLNKKYGRGDGKTWGDSYSRYGLVEETEATYQALRDGGTLYMTGETETAVYLATSRAKPEEWTGIDPDSVPPNLTVREGRERRTVLLLSLTDPNDAVTVECRQDREVDKHLGYSDAVYRHEVAGLFRWPGFRPVEEWGQIHDHDPDKWDHDDDDSEQTTLTDGGRVINPNARHRRYQTRIPIDLDGDKHANFRFEATRVYRNLQRIADDVRAHVSSGQGGLHLMAWFEDALSFEEQIAIRREHGDDPRRVNMDIQRWNEGTFHGICFQQKSSRNTVKERRFSDVADALDYIGERRNDYDRMKRVANHGHKGDPEYSRRVTEVNQE